MTKRFLCTLWPLLLLAVLLGSGISFADLEREDLGGGIIRYYNHYAGYSIVLPASLEEDASIFEKRVRLYNDEVTVDIFYDHFEDGFDTYEVYNSYSNRDLLNNKRFTVEKSYSAKSLWFHVDVLIYSREKIASIPNDKNHYFCATVKKNDREVYTIFVKSTEPKKNLEYLFYSFRLEPQTEEYEPIKLSPVERPLSEKAQAFWDLQLRNPEFAQFGIFAPVRFTPLRELEETLDYNFGLALIYKSVSSKPPLQDLREATESDRALEYTFQTVTVVNDAPGVDTTFDILNGEYDELLIRHIDAIKACGQPVLFRLNNEMNGDWCLYSAYYLGRDTDLYVALYRYIHDLFQQRGADNVLFVFNPNERSFPNYAWNHGFCYYPGDEYVDVVGLTGYNTGTYYKGEYWRGFREIYDPIYEEYVRKFDHPLIVTEFACSSFGGDKIAWINDMFDQLKSYPRVRYWIWWNGQDYDVNKKPSRIYRLDENQETLEVFKKRLQELKEGGKDNNETSDRRNGGAY